MLEMWGIKAIVRRQKPMVSKTKTHDSICEPTTSQLNSRSVYPPLIVKFQPVCDRCYKVYKRLESEMSSYDAQQRKLRLREAEETRKFKSKDIHLPNFRHCSDPLNIDIDSFIPSEEPQEENIFETGASKFGMSSKRYRHTLAKSVASDRLQPVSPPKISADRPASRHNNFEVRMARLLVRSPQTRSNITANKAVHTAADSQPPIRFAPTESTSVGNINVAAEDSSKFTPMYPAHDETEAKGRVQTWFHRPEDESMISDVSPSPSFSKEHHQSAMMRVSQNSQQNVEASSTVDLSISGSAERQLRPGSPPLTAEQQPRPKSTTKAPLLSVGAALERKLAGDTIEPAPPAQEQEPPHPPSSSGNVLSTAPAPTGSTSLPKDRKHVNQESSSFSFQKLFHEPETVDHLLPSTQKNRAADPSTASSHSYKLTSADVLAATSVLDITSRQSEQKHFTHANPIEAEPPKLSYEANAFVTNLKFSISDEARFLQELGSSRTKVISERRKKIEQLVMLCSSI
jgi:hypothetical protein